MEERLKRLVLTEIKNRYKKEKFFYEDVLQINKSSWILWKNENILFEGIEEKIIKKLFTSLEWIVAKEVIANHDIEKKDYELYVKKKVELSRKYLLQENSQVMLKNIDPKQKYAPKKYRVMKTRIYICEMKDEEIKNVVTLIVKGFAIREIPRKKKNLSLFIGSLRDEELGLINL